MNMTYACPVTGVLSQLIATDTETKGLLVELKELLHKRDLRQHTLDALQGTSLAPLS